MIYWRRSMQSCKTTLSRFGDLLASCIAWYVCLSCATRSIFNMGCRSAISSVTNPACARNYLPLITSFNSWILPSISTSNQPTRPTSFSSSACFLSGTSASSNGPTCSDYGKACGPTISAAISTYSLHLLSWRNIVMSL